MSTREISVESGMGDPSLAKAHPIVPLMAKAMKDRGAFPELPAVPTRKIYWPKEFFALNRVAVFLEATREQQNEILLQASEMLLKEGYYIEKGGMYYTSKMAILSKTAQEKALYSLFSADEAAHFYWISSFVEVKDPETYKQNPFLVLLDEIAQKQNKAVMTYLLQVVLEGWGVNHYHELSSGCLDPDLTKVFQLILRDEAKHHGAGLLLFQAQEMLEHADELAKILKTFLQMIQCGPQGLVAILRRVLESPQMPWTEDQVQKIFEELGAVQETRRKLDLIKGCIEKGPLPQEMLTRLRGSFEPFSASVCTQIALN